MSDTPDREGEAKFESLAAALAPYFGKPSEKIPEDLRIRIARDLSVAPPWDTLSEDQQRIATAQWDFKNDPALENERCRIYGLTLQLHEMKASNPGNRPSEIETKRLRVTEIKAEISRLGAEPSRATEATKAAATPLRAPTAAEADNLVAQYRQNYGKNPDQKEAEAFAQGQGFAKPRAEMRAALARATGARGRGRPSSNSQR